MTAKSRKKYISEDEDFEDESGSSYDGKGSPLYSSSPSTEALYTYSNKSRGSSLLNFFPSQKGKSSLPQKQVAEENDSELIDLYLPQVREILGSKYSEGEMQLALQKANYDPDKAINSLLSSKDGGQFAMEMDWEADAKPESKEVQVGLEQLKLTPSQERVLNLSSSSSSITQDKPEKFFKKSPKFQEKEQKVELQDPAKEIKTSKSSKQMSATRKKEIEQKIQSQSSEKPHLNMVVIGHVDAGKSTIMGHLLYLLGNVTAKTVHKYEKESKDRGKGSFSFAWIMDQHEEERNRGITMDVGVTNFETEHKRITLLDAPGHRDFVPNMISGTAQADVALLVINANTGEFEAGFESQGQTKEHAILARSLGVTSLGVAINKLDAVEWSKERYDQITAKLGVFLKQTGFKEKDIWYVPCSGLTGENILESTQPKLKVWYFGPTLVQRIDSFQPAKREIEKPLRFCISDVYKAQNFGTAVGGKVESGIVSVGDKLLLLPLNELCTVRGIRAHNQDAVEFATAGDNVDLSLVGIELASIGIGNILCDPENPIPISNLFTAQIIVFGVQKPIFKGHTVELHYQSLNEAAHLRSLVSLLDKNTGEVKKKNPRILVEGQTAIVKIKTRRPICIEKYADFKQLGRFTLREDGRTIAAGVVTEVVSSNHVQ